MARSRTASVTPAPSRGRRKPGARAPSGEGESGRARGGRGRSAEPSAVRGRPESEGPSRASSRSTAADAAAPAASATQKLHKVLAQAGFGSRRAMEELIRGGKVMVNGKPASLGMRVSPEDLVKVGRRQIRFKLSARLPRMIVYHKPEGEIVSRDDPQGRASVFDRLPVIRGGKWLAIGRLDYNTCGLLVFTTSGELANRFSHPRFQVEREYAVRILGELDEEQSRALLAGVALDDGDARLDLLEPQGGSGRNRWYRVIVREGRNRLVRRLFEHFGLQVSRLMRTRFGIINMPPRLKRGQHLELTEAQTRKVLEWLAAGGTESPPVPPPAPPTPARRSQAGPERAAASATRAPGRPRARAAENVSRETRPPRGNARAPAGAPARRPRKPRDTGQ